MLKPIIPDSLSTLLWAGIQLQEKPVCVTVVTLEAGMCYRGSLGEYNYTRMVCVTVVALGDTTTLEAGMCYRGSLGEYNYTRSRYVLPW